MEGVGIRVLAGLRKIGVPLGRPWSHSDHELSARGYLSRCPMKNFASQRGF